MSQDTEDLAARLAALEATGDKKRGVARPSPLAAILSDARTTKVFHACTQDLEVILEGMGCACSPVFDTQVGAAFLGMRQQASYGALVEQYEGVHLAKTEALTDWSMRPLDPEQLSYAEDDVRYLPAI